MTCNGKIEDYTVVSTNRKCDLIRANTDYWLRRCDTGKKFKINGSEFTDFAFVAASGTFPAGSILTIFLYSIADDSKIVLADDIKLNEIAAACEGLWATCRGQGDCQFLTNAVLGFSVNRNLTSDAHITVYYKIQRLVRKAEKPEKCEKKKKEKKCPCEDDY